MTVIMGTNSRSSSRTKAPGRMSLTKLRHGSSGGQGPSSTLGGHPMVGADPNKKDIKHRFEITKKLGSGTYGKVSLAYDHKTEREVAVKLIKKSAIENKQDLIRIRREIRIMSMLKHPNIIEIYEVFENKDKIILVMEYASGGELYDYVSKCGSLPEAEARRIFREITSAVLYCHKHKVAHRDLKLENILLDIKNNAKIADFGLSNYFNDKNLLNTFCGSPLYASPEIINGTPYHGPEVDCWSLGILLYTLVYGSMPFDGHDFNRMVRQIKRGTYYEPETPSTASMLIRNMLRVNPDRRADIDDIASHWWLNLEENMPVIQELPENQITDHTPLTERAEVLYVQDLADETDVFMEFGHLSSATRQKIEEFRRRRKEAEEYNENSPIKPPKRKNDEKPEMTAQEKSLRQQEEEKKPEKIDMSDPLERLKQLENRLATKQSSASPEDQPSSSKSRRGSKPEPVEEKEKEKPVEKEKTPVKEPEPDNKPAFVSPTISPKPSSSTHKHLPMNVWKHESDSLNILMNQVLEQMDKGPVSMNLVARVKAHPMYEHRPTIKELLESIISAQPASVRKEASKVIEQACNTLKRDKKSDKNIPQTPTTSKAPTIPETVHEDPKKKYEVAELPTRVDVKAATTKRFGLEERKWHSVEVGFETDEESSSNGSSGSRKNSKVSNEPKFIVRDTKSAGHALDEEEELDDEEECEDESEYESEIDDLAEVVEQAAQSTSQVLNAPTIVESLSENQELPPQTEISGNHLSTLDRRLAKRQSKGKYQHYHVEMYGRGVSNEADSPPPAKKPIGGPQPSLEQSPVLFDKAKKLIMEYPSKTDAPEEKEEKKQAKWTKTQDPDVSDKSATATPTPARKQSNEKAPEAPTEAPKAKPESEEEEESEDEGEIIRKPRTSMIIGFRTIKNAGTEGQPKEAPIVEIKPQTKPYQGINAAQKTPPKDKNSMSPELSTTPPSEGKMNYESAAMYIRRKNRERRARTLTIAITEEAWQRIAEKTPEPLSPLTHSSKPSSPSDKNDVASKEFETKLRDPPIRRLINRQSSKGTSDNQQSNYHRNSYLEERGALSDRRKSFHEYSPVDHDDYASVYGNQRPGGYSNYGNTRTSRFDYEDPISQNWTPSEPSRNRFEVYQTRAERDRNAAGSSIGSHYYGDRSGISSYAPSTSVRSQYGDYSQSSYRRPSAYDTDPVGTSDYMYNIGSSNYSSQIPDPYAKDRFRPVTRRLSNNMKDRARSQSNDRKFSTGSRTDLDAAAAMANRLMTPEVSAGITDYGYISYHDSGNVRMSQPRDPDLGLGAPRSILKNKQAYEIEPRAHPQSSGPARMRSAISAEKSFGPLGVSQFGYGPPPRMASTGPVGFSAFQPPPVPIYGHVQVPRGRTPGSEMYEPLSTSTGPKRSTGTGPSSFLNLRRRTAEIRLGNDGKMTTTTNGIHIDDYKRPRSPIDRIKSLFGGTTSSTKSKPASSSVYSSTNGSSRYSSALPSTSSQFKRYGAGGNWF